MEEWQPKRLLVTGGAGFIGSCFVGQAVERGQEVIVLDKMTYAGHRANLDWIDGQGWSGSYQFVEGDIADSTLVQDLLQNHRIDAVVHFAAESHVDNSIASPGEFIETNVVGAYRLLEAARHYWNALADELRGRFRYVHVSTDEVYGELGETGKFSETSPISPNSPYSASKAAGDHFTKAWHHTYGLPAIVTNCSNNYGPRHFPEKLIPLMIAHALEGKSLPVYGSGKNIRDWIHVEDHCRGVYLALTRGVPGETYCFGGNSERRNLEVVEQICDILSEIGPEKGRNYRELIEFVEDRAGHDWRYAIDDSKAQKELGFSRQYKNFEEGLRATIEWYLANRQWQTRVMQRNEQAA